MSETEPTVPTFRQTKHGYDPVDVHARIDELDQQLSEARSNADTERRRADEAEQAAEGVRAELRKLEQRTGVPSYDVVAQRVRAILESADAAAVEMRTSAEHEAETSKRQAEDRVAQILAEARVEADATVRRGRDEAAKAIATAERHVQGLRVEIAQLEQQRDRVLDALNSLRDRLTHVAQDLVPANDDMRSREDRNVVPMPTEEAREPKHHEYAHAEAR